MSQRRPARRTRQGPEAAVAAAMLLAASPSLAQQPPVLSPPQAQLLAQAPSGMPQALNAPGMTTTPRPVGPPSVTETRVGGRGSSSNLLEQAAFWQQQGQSDRALQTLDRLLAVEPNNVDALALAVELASVNNQAAAAQRYLARLRRIAPDDPGVVRGDELARLLSDDSQTLSSARQLASSGRGAEAVTRYQQLFRNGRVPGALAPEYYQILAGTSEAGYRTAVQQLQNLVAAAPRDFRLGLTYAQILTYREETRPEGVDRLQQLYGQRGMREPARAAWRQALLWSADEAETAVRIRAYLAANPGDREIEAKLRASEAGIAPGASARTSGWISIEQTRFAEAERQFNQAITLDPTDSEAVVGLAVLYKVQNRMAEARRMLDRAIALSPDRAEEFNRMVGPLTPWVAGAGGGTGGFALGPSGLAWRALQAGDLDRADALARRGLNARGQERIDSELVLGQIAVQRRDFVAAETRFRNVLTLRPRQRDAMNGLYLALVGQERIAEADAFQREMGLPANTDAAAMRAFSVRDRAGLATASEQRLRLLREAQSLAPGNPWITMDLIRALRATGRDDEARDLEARLETDTTAEGSTAAAMLALDQERFGAAVALLERVPQRVRNPDTNRLLTQSRREFEIRQIEMQVREGRPGALDALLAQAGRRDPGFTTGPAVVRAFGRLNDPLRAGMAARAAFAANPNTSANDRIAMASALLDANRLEDASALAAPLLADRSLSAETRRELASVMETGAVQQADGLALRNAPEQGYQVLAPALSAAPTSVPLNMALVRLYVATHRTAEARQLVDAVLERDPRNLAARLAKVELALAEGNNREADALITETAFLYPNEAQVTLAEARVARARGDFVRQLRLVESVAARRIDHLRNSGQLAEASLTQQALRPTRNGPTPTQLHDPLTAQIAQELIRARDEASTWMQSGPYVQYRDGDRGTGRLLNVTVPTEVSTPMRGGIGGRVTVGMDAVSLNTGQFNTNSQTARFFASNPLTTPDNYQQARSAMQGVGMRLAYTNQNIRLDVGTTPLGFSRTNVVGGAEIVPRINEQLRVRLSFERRAVTDSLLSYAGQRSSIYSPSWGNVIRTGGRIQLEYAPVERFGLYAGAGYSVYRGNNVANNWRVEAGVGAYYGVIRQPNQQLSVGVDLRYLSFDRNLSGFTFGQGGYFSPQQSVTASLQADYMARWGDWSLRTIGSVGYQAFRTSASPLFASNPSMQAQLVNLTGGDPAQPTTIAATRSNGITGSIFGNLEYAVTPDLRLGIAGRWERVGNYEDTVGLFYMRWRLDRPRADLLPLYAGQRYPTLNVNDPINSSFGQGRPEWVQLPGGQGRPTW